MKTCSADELQNFIVTAKKASYVGSGQHSLPRRPDAHELEFQLSPFAYLDSYFGGQDFIGQETVYYEGKAIWAMNYYGYILLPERITGAESGMVIKESLSRMYAEGRFLGGFQHQCGDKLYVDTSQGDHTRFSGKEWIAMEGEVVYELLYHGGMIR